MSAANGAERDEGGDEIADWGARARKAMETRNDLVHAAWIMRAGEHAVGHRSRRRGMTFERRTRQDFADAEALMRHVYDDGVALANALYERRREDH